jgi:putative transposase
MPWREVHPMDQRVELIKAYESGCFTVVELSEQFGVSRKTAYKWINRHETNGLPGLAELSRAPHGCPHKTPKHIVEALIALRRRHRLWGPRKLLCKLAQQYPSIADTLPAASTVGDMLKRAGLVEKRRRRIKPGDHGSVALFAPEPNDVWCADFKGEFLTKDAIWCYPFTLTDAFSRYLLGCDAKYSVEHSGAQQSCERIFAEVGLPIAIRTDNGCPFCSTAIAGLSRLSVWWMKLGIVHQRIEPGKPQQNGRHERMHRTLKAETTRPPAQNLKLQQERFNGFRDEYNQERPHEAIEMQTPSSIWRPSSRPLPAELKGPQYPGHWVVKRVDQTGTVNFRGKTYRLSGVLAHEQVALEEVDDGIWSVFFYNTLLGRLDERTLRIVHTPLQPQVGGFGGN